MVAFFDGISFFFLSDLDFICIKEQVEFVRNRLYAYI